MRIGVNARLLLADRMEGIATYTAETCQRMVAEHPEDDFIFFFDRAYDEAFIYGENVTAVILKPEARHPWLWQYWFDYALARQLEKYQIDVLYSPESYLSLRSDVPCVMVTHDIAYIHYPQYFKKSHLRYFQKFVPAYHDRAKHIITVSEATKMDVVKHFSIESTKITVAHNAVRSGFNPISKTEKQAVRSKITNDQPYIIYLGSIHPRKNVKRLIKAFESVCEKGNANHKLVLYGRWAFDHHDVSKMIKASKSKERIILANDEVIKVESALAAADCLAYVSLYEGFGLPIIEAMQCGVPVLSSDVSSMPEVCGDAAILVNPGSVESISQGIEKLLQDQDSTESLILKGYENVQRFSWNNTANIIYQKLKTHAQ